MSYCAEIQQLTGPLLKSVNWHGDGDWCRCKSVTAKQWEVCFPLNHDNRPRSLFFPFVQPLAFAFGLREFSRCMQWWWHLDDWWPVTLWWLLFCCKSVTVSHFDTATRWGACLTFYHVRQTPKVLELLFKSVWRRWTFFFFSPIFRSGQCCCHQQYWFLEIL